MRDTPAVYLQNIDNSPNSVTMQKAEGRKENGERRT
jgi:hypothetical protein